MANTYFESGNVCENVKYELTNVFKWYFTIIWEGLMYFCFIEVFILLHLNSVIFFYKLLK